MGTGTSQGVPMIAHANEGCDLSNPKNWRTRSSIHVVMDGYHVQVDASPEFRMQCLRHDISQIDLFLLTHGHADHILGMDDLRRFCDLRGFTALPVYTSPEAGERIAAIFPYAMGKVPVRRGYPAFDVQVMPEVLETPGGRIYRTYLPHGNLLVLGLVFEEASTGKRLAYYNDCKRVPEEAEILARGAEVVVLDGLRPTEHPTHMSIGEAVETAARIHAPQTYLIHMTYQVDHRQTQEHLPAGVFLSWDGLRLIL